MIVSATTEHEILGSIPGSTEELPDFSLRKFPVTARSLCDGGGKIVMESAKKVLLSYAKSFQKPSGSLTSAWITNHAVKLVHTATLQDIM